jgi:predicted nucleic acid-binding protein
MSVKRCFFDTNVLVYLATDEIHAPCVREIMHENAVISTQVMNELLHVLRRKFAFTWEDVEDFLILTEATMDIQDLTLLTHKLGRRLSRRYGFATYDAMIVAAALEAGCDVLWSEDMQNGLSVEGRLVIRNPFAA